MAGESVYGMGVVAFSVLGYATCSSLMLIVNKMVRSALTQAICNVFAYLPPLGAQAVHFLPAPSFVLLMQVTASWSSVKFVGLLGFIDVDEIEWGKMKAFLGVSVAFLACLFANIKTLQYANVETFIVFRASTPLLIGVCDWACLGRELPNMRSGLSMLALLGGAVLYVQADASFEVRGYQWVAIWCKSAPPTLMHLLIRLHIRLLIR